jgi:uncharacterized protein YndB with AHSA1/START domain
MADVVATEIAQEHREIRLSRLFSAPRAIVFKAWCSADHVKHWFCPAAFTIPEAKVEFRVGGAFEVCMRGPDGAEHWTRGRFTEIVPVSRLVIVMDAFDRNGRHVFIANTTVTFADDAGGTKMDVVQAYTLLDPAGLPMIEGAPAGWGQTLDRLEAEIARMEEQPTEIHQVKHDLLKAQLDGKGVVAHGSFTLERLYGASPARVWKALTDRDAKTKWFGGPPGQFEVLERIMDVRPGGRERLKGSWNGGVVSAFDAVYFDVIPNERLVYAYEMHLDDLKISVSLATLVLKAEDGKTRLVVTEHGAFLDGYEDGGSRKEGTAGLLDALGASLRD